ncbi:MAG: gluconate 2-dehydrogenase subunit 3 family protein [Anaerolineales bacterium]|nr:gluconate 2-dehydrogenase subunit 3 family protein [Anaerolineales bacterium]
MVTWQIADNKFDFSITHSITASKEIVYRVLADMEAYPEFVNDLVSVTRQGDLYKFVARAAILTVSATLKVVETPDQAVHFELIEGPVDALTGSWLVEEGRTPEQTRVTLTLHAETHARGEWLLRMTGKYVQNKTDKLIAAFSARAEALQRSGGVPPARPRIKEASGFLGWLKRLWARISGSGTSQPAAEERQVSAKPAFLQNEHFLQTLEALASTMLPPDDFDAGVQDMGFVSVVEMRARYEAGREALYVTALQAVDQMARSEFNKPGFVDLSPAERTALLEAVRQNRANGADWDGVKPSSFFSALWEDVVFLYCTHPDTWQRIGFPGPSFEAGGYRDFDQVQQFMGQMFQTSAQ